MKLQITRKNKTKHCCCGIVFSSISVILALFHEKWRHTIAIKKTAIRLVFMLSLHFPLGFTHSTFHLVFFIHFVHSLTLEYFYETGDLIHLWNNNLLVASKVVTMAFQTDLVLAGSRPGRPGRRWVSRVGWCWWCRRGASFGWPCWTWSLGTPGLRGSTGDWSSSWPADGRWPTRHFLCG